MTQKDQIKKHSTYEEILLEKHIALHPEWMSTCLRGKSHPSSKDPKWLWVNFKLMTESVQGIWWMK